MNPWLIFGITTISIVILGPAACTIHSNQMVSDMVQLGAAPAEAKCALPDSFYNESNEVTCLTAALLRSIEGKLK